VRQSCFCEALFLHLVSFCFISKSLFIFILGLCQHGPDGFISGGHNTMPKRCQATEATRFAGLCLRKGGEWSKTRQFAPLQDRERKFNKPWSKTQSRFVFPSWRWFRNTSSEEVYSKLALVDLTPVRLSSGKIQRLCCRGGEEKKTDTEDVSTWAGANTRGSDQADKEEGQGHV
jgi:hypothetical protein